MIDQPAPDDPEVPGLAGERTDLAWNRTGLAAAVAAAAILRRAWESVDTLTGRVVIYSLIGAGSLVLALSLWLSSPARSAIEGRPVADTKRLRALTSGTVVFCLLALVLALTA